MRIAGGFAALVVLIGMAPAALGGVSYASPEVAFEQGLGAYKAGFFDRAVPALEEAAAHAAGLNRFYAEFYLARIYSDNTGAETDHAKAYRLFQKLAEQNADAEPDDGQRAPFVAKALIALAGYLHRGVREIGVEPDPERAFEYLQHAATFFDDKDAQFELAKLYLSGSEEDVKRGMHYLAVLTGEGHPGAQAVLADLYWRGRFVNKDEKRALALIRMAVENAPAHERLWIEDIYQNIFCAASQGTRKQADGMVAVWRKMFTPPPAPVESLPYGGLGLGDLGGRAMQPQRTCGNGELISIQRYQPAAGPPGRDAATLPPVNAADGARTGAAAAGQGAETGAIK
jgi:TPR repeat protein